MNLVFYLTGACVAAGIACGLYRLLRGPSVVDRLLAFDMITVSAVGGVVLVSALRHTADYLELILILASLGFFGTVAMVFLLDRTPEEPEESGEDRPDNPPPPAAR